MYNGPLEMLISIAMIILIIIAMVHVFLWGTKMIKYVNGTTKKKQVKEEYPNHVKIVKVTGGYAVFETWDDYETWRNQK